ncbi:MAG TPA: hypothetical protein VIT91_13340 [Chthoniobacterales bacterium]
MKRVKIREINDQDGKALTARWSYYDQKSDEVNYRQLKQVVHPNGYWERYEYSSRGPTKTVAQSLNAPVGAAETIYSETLGGLVKTRTRSRLTMLWAGLHNQDDDFSR